MVGDLASAINAPLIYIGDKLGLFKAMADGQPVNSEELAQKNWTDRALCARMAACDDRAGVPRAYDPDTRRASLSSEHALVLAKDGSPVFLMGAAQMIRITTPSFRK